LVVGLFAHLGAVSLAPLPVLHEVFGEVRHGGCALIRRWRRS
jgi:hypothetical protein